MILGLTRRHTESVDTHAKVHVGIETFNFWGYKVPKAKRSLTFLVSTCFGQVENSITDWRFAILKHTIQLQFFDLRFFKQLCLSI